MHPDNNLSPLRREVSFLEIVGTVAKQAYSHHQAQNQAQILLGNLKHPEQRFWLGIVEW
jgi:hypothetical protein